MSNTFAEHAAAYALAGWSCIIPVPAAAKFPPPTGFTGAEGRDTTVDDLVGWAGTHASSSIALRMPMWAEWGVIGIDVDAYEKLQGGELKQKHGAETLAVHEAMWGPLPPTWTSTARGSEVGPGISGIRFFRVPAGRYATVLRATQPDGSETSDIEIIQRHHRYAVVWPSPNQSAGAIYRWYAPSGQPVDAPPKPDELTWLPQAWVEGLSAGATAATVASASRGEGEAMLDQIAGDFRPQCADIVNAQAAAVKELSGADPGSRYEAMRDRVWNLVQYGAGGHPGVGAALMVVRELWEQLTAGEGREAELDRATLNAAQKAVTTYGPVQIPNDPCELMAGGMAHGSPYVQAAAPTPLPGGVGGPNVVEGVDLTIVEVPRWVGVRQFIGAHAFDPPSGLDQPLAESVLARTYPALQYAYDSKAWLLRTTDRWELHDKMAGWAVAQVAELMPKGDPEADKGSEAQLQAARRAAMLSASGSSGVTKKMEALVSGGMHPATVKLGDLDSDPEVLWAGARPWDLRASYEQPTLAAIDPNTPHLHSAAIVPARVPTPRWDAFLEAVWPDPELRAWALRVLSISLTGYADRALPILLGETGRGKTQVVALLMSVLGTYAHSANPKLLSPNANEHDTIVFDLKGRRLSFIDEAPSEAKAGQERLKQLTGGGDLTGRQMNTNPVTFAPSHTFVLTSNDPPTLTDAAVRSRTRLIPCTGDPEQVKEARAAIGAPRGAVWRAEAPGVLAAMMAETAAWLADASSAAVTAAPENIRYLAELHGAEQDPVTSWVAEECEAWEPGTGSTELYQQFTASCLRNNLRRDAIPTMQKWGRTLTQLGYDAVHTRTGKLRKLRVRPAGFSVADPTPAPEAHIRHTYPSHESGVVQSTITQTPIGDGYGGSGDGSVTASGAYPSQAYPQVNPPVSVSGDGCDGYTDLTTHIHTPTQAGEAEGGNAPYPSQPTEQGGVAEAPATPAKPSRKKAAATPEEKAAKTEAARIKRLEASAAKRAAAVAEASGPMVPLPAVLQRDGSLTPVTADQADALLLTITGPAGHGELTVDVEHTGYPVGHRDYALRTVQLGDETFTVVLEHDGDLTAGQDAVSARHLQMARVLHAHSATADLVPVVVAGMIDEDSAWAKMDDTAIRAKLADPASTGNADDLKGLAKSMLGPLAVAPEADKARSALFKAGNWLTDTEVLTPVERSGWAQVDPYSATMVRYAGSDVLDCAALARRLPMPSEAVMSRERLAQRMTARVAHHGVRINGEQVAKLLPEHEEAKARHLELVQAYGIDNPGSPKQVGEAFLRLGANLPPTDTGKPSVAASVLEGLAADRDREPANHVENLAREMLTWRHHDTALKLFLRPYDAMVRNGDGRARPTVYTLGADTGRMSCVRPNLQQLPREGGFRACITADPGYSLISVDFSSVEVRVAAALSQDPNLIRMVLDDIDLHAEIAKLVWGPNFTKAQRYKAKRKVFGRLYGQGLNGMARTDGAGFEVAKSVISAMDALTPGLTQWSEDTRQAIEAGQTAWESYSGRVIHMPAGASHAGANYKIQGSARELLIDALIRWSQTPWGECVIVPVHDEVVAFVPTEQAHEATEALQACMTTELYGVPIAAAADEPSFEWGDSA